MLLNSLIRQRVEVALARMQTQQGDYHKPMPQLDATAWAPVCRCCAFRRSPIAEIDSTPIAAHKPYSVSYGTNYENGRHMPRSTSTIERIVRRPFRSAFQPDRLAGL